MKKTIITRVLSLMLALLLAVPLCLSVLGGNTAAAASSDEPGVFILQIEYEDKSCLTTAFVVYDDDTDKYYLVADPIFDALLDYSPSFTVFGVGYTETAAYLGSDGNFLYLSATGLESFIPLTMAGSFIEEGYLCIQGSDDDGNIVGCQAAEVDLGAWNRLDSGIYESDVENGLELLNAPIVKDLHSYAVVAVMGFGENDYYVAYPATSWKFSSEYALSTYSAGQTPSETQSQGQEEHQKEPSSATGLSLDKGLLIVAVIVIVAVVILFGKRSTKKSSSYSEPVSDRREGTISLDPEPPIGNPNPAPMDYTVPNPQPVPTPAPAPAQWQIRGMGGVMDGRIFLLSGTLRLGRSRQNDVVFPESTAGISGTHCQLSIEHGNVVLRDLQSTYGTYLGNNVKMEPQISYNLRNGDTFTLAEGGQTFRLEKAGNAVRDMTPAVRSADGKTYRADMDGKVTFGRDPRSQVPFDGDDDSVSTNHCVLYRENGQLYLRDTNSTNGTFFSADERLRPNMPYKVRKGMSFFLVSPKNTFVITED